MRDSAQLVVVDVLSWLPSSISASLLPANALTTGPALNMGIDVCNGHDTPCWQAQIDEAEPWSSEELLAIYRDYLILSHFRLLSTW